MEILNKGENISLDTIKYTENNILVGLGWDLRSSNEFDIDVSAFLLSDEEIIRSNKDFIFYNQPKDSNNCIELYTSTSNKNIISAFNISLSKIPLDVKKIMFVLTIDQAEDRNQNFGMVDDIKLYVYDNEKNKEELIEYSVNIENKETSLLVCSLYIYNGKWKFKAIGQGFSEGLDIIANKYNVNLGELSSELSDNSSMVECTDNQALKRKRRTPNQIFLENSNQLLNSFKCILPSIHSAVDNKLNESNTRMILDKIFIDILGYKMEEIKAEQEIQGRRADYVFSIDGIDVLVIEVKKAGMTLRKKQVFQATSYGAYAGIKWVLLTNLVQWQIYHVSTQDRVEGNLVFSIDLSSNITQEDSELLVLISRYGLNRKSLIEKVWAETNALSENSIISSILTDDVINKIRIVIKRDKGISVNNEKIQEVLEKILNIN